MTRGGRAMEMHQVRYFLAVSELLNFTRAAERCNVSQPALTRAIQALEDELGGPLFRRERSNTHLTELGRLMRPHLAEVLAQSDAARIRAREFARLRDTPLTLGVMCSIGPARLLELIHRFQERHATVNVLLRDADGASLQKALAEGELDVALFGLPGEVDDRFHTVPLFRERFVIAFPPGHRFGQLNAVPLGELAAERYLSRVGCEYADYMTRIYDERGIELNIPFESPREDWIQTMVMAGLGVTFIPENSLTVAGLQARPLIDPEVERQINLVTVRGRQHSPAVGAFVREAMSFRWP